MTRASGFLLLLLAGAALSLSGLGCEPKCSSGQVAIRNEIPTLGVYYGYVSEVTTGTTKPSGMSDVEWATEVFGAYDIVIFPGDIVSPGFDPTELKKARQIVANLKKNLKKGTGSWVYGYIDLGVKKAANLKMTSTPNVDSIQTRINAWRDMGVWGIFLDNAGYDWCVDRKRQRDAVELVKVQANLGSVFINAYHPDDVFGSKKAGRTNDHFACGKPMNENGISPHETLGIYDYYLFENYQIKDGSYQTVHPKGTATYQCADSWVCKSDLLRTYRANGNLVRVATLTTIGSNTFDQAKFNYAWYSTLFDGFDAMGWGERNFSAGATGQAWADSLPWHKRPTRPKIGKCFTSPVVKHDATKKDEHTRTTDKVTTLLLNTGSHKLSCDGAPCP